MDQPEEMVTGRPRWGIRFLEGVRTFESNHTVAVVCLGIVLPLAALIIDHLNPIGQTLSLVGAELRLPRLGYLERAAGLSILALVAWLSFFRAHAWRFDGFLGGILSSSALLHLALTVAAIDRLSIIFPFWFPPAGAALAHVSASVRAFKRARSVMPPWAVVVTGILGVVPLIALAAHDQPWAVVKLMPDLRNADLRSMDLSHIHLSGCHRVSLSRASLDHADLRYASVGGCKMSMRNASLRGVNLAHADLHNVDLSYADLRDARLDETRVYMADLKGADLRGASLGDGVCGRIELEHVDLRGADLRKMKDMRCIYSWKGVRYDETTRWPANMKQEQLCRWGKNNDVPAVTVLPDGSSQLGECGPPPPP